MMNGMWRLIRPVLVLARQHQPAEKLIHRVEILLLLGCNEHQQGDELHLSLAGSTQWFWMLVHVGSIRFRTGRYNE